MIIRFDGAVRGQNPGGKVQIGWHIYMGNIGISREVFEGGLFATNNVAEYIALIHAMIGTLRMDPRPTTVTYQGDTEIVIKQMRGEYEVGAPTTLCMNGIARLLLHDLIEAGIVVEFEWIPRLENGPADALSKRKFVRTP